MSRDGHLLISGPIKKCLHCASVMDGFNTDHLLNYGRRHCWGIGCASSFSLRLQGRLLQALKEEVEGCEGGREDAVLTSAVSSQILKLCPKKKSSAAYTFCKAMGLLGMQFHLFENECKSPPRCAEWLRPPTPPLKAFLCPPPQTTPTASPSSRPSAPTRSRCSTSAPRVPRSSSSSWRT